MDEIHRFNKAQQDAFLPYVERGTIRLIGATTENPSFEIISALLSRCRVYVLEPLSEEQIAALLRRALEDRERGLGALELTADDDALELIAGYSSGDCRTAYNTLEVAAQLALEPDRPGGKHIDRALAAVAVQQRVLLYDKSGEEHYNLISALHKSVRNSDPDAALYWLARMFAAGEDPLYLARRVVRMAVEDIGLAAPEALNLCLSAKQAIDFLGSPEGDLALAEAVVYLCARAQVEFRLHGLWRGAAGDRAHPPGAGAAAPAQRAHPADEGTGATARAIATRTTKKAAWPTWTACPTRCAGAATTSPRRKAAKNSSPSAWKRSGGFGPENTAEDDSFAAFGS